MFQLLSARNKSSAAVVIGSLQCQRIMLALLRWLPLFAFTFFSLHFQSAFLYLQYLHLHRSNNTIRSSSIWITDCQISDSQLQVIASSSATFALSLGLFFFFFFFSSGLSQFIISPLQYYFFSCVSIRAIRVPLSLRRLPVLSRTVHLVLLNRTMR